MAKVLMRLMLSAVVLVFMTSAAHSELFFYEPFDYPVGSLIGRLPPQLSSSMEPNELGSEPLMVPDANRSPGRRAQPLLVWWASCWAMFQ